MAVHWIVLLCAIFPLWLLQNVIHELSHGLTIWLGWKWKFSIYPFPSKKLGRFTFAHVIYEKAEGSEDISAIGMALVAIMPKITNILFVLKAQIWATISIGIPSIAIVILLFAWFNFVDFIVGALAIFKSANESDIWKFQSYTNIRPKLIRGSVIGWTIYLLICNIAGTVFVLTHI